MNRDPFHTPRVGHELRSVLKRRLEASERVPQDPVPQVLPLHLHLDGDEDAVADENFFPACLTGRGNKEIQARASDDTESVLHTPRPNIVQLDAVSPEKLPKIKSRDAEAKHHVGPHTPEGILVPLKHESLDATAKHHVGPHSPEDFFTAAYEVIAAFGDVSFKVCDTLEDSLAVADDIIPASGMDHGRVEPPEDPHTLFFVQEPLSSGTSASRAVGYAEGATHAAASHSPQKPKPGQMAHCAVDRGVFAQASDTHVGSAPSRFRIRSP